MAHTHVIFVDNTEFWPTPAGHAGSASGTVPRCVLKPAKLFIAWLKEACRPPLCPAELRIKDPSLHHTLHHLLRMHVLLQLAHALICPAQPHHPASRPVMPARSIGRNPMMYTRAASLPALSAGPSLKLAQRMILSSKAVGYRVQVGRHSVVAEGMS